MQYGKSRSGCGKTLSRRLSFWNAQTSAPVRFAGIVRRAKIFGHKKCGPGSPFRAMPMRRTARCAARRVPCRGNRPSAWRVAPCRARNRCFFFFSRKGRPPPRPAPRARTRLGQPTSRQSGDKVLSHPFQRIPLNLSAEGINYVASFRAPSQTGGASP